MFVDVVNGVVMRGPSSKLSYPLKGVLVPARFVGTNHDSVFEVLEGPVQTFQDGVALFTYTPRELEDAVTRLAEAVKREAGDIFDEYSRGITKGTTERGISTWAQQKAEADVYTVDLDAPTPLLSALALAREIDLDILVSKVLEAADAYAVAVGTLLGREQAIGDLVDAAVIADDLEELKRIRSEELALGWF